MNHRYNKWSEYEDNILSELVGKYGNKNWTLISRLMRKNFEIHKRSGKQCRERWINHLNRAKQQLTWTLEDDQKLISLQAELGTKWSEISRCFQRRSDNNIKNRFYSIIRKAIRKMCRYVKIKTTSMNVYTVKPSTLSQIFMLGSAKTRHQGQGYNSTDLLSSDGFHLEDYSLITQTINYFIFDEYKESKHVLPAPERVVDSLNKLMEVSSHLAKISHQQHQFSEQLQESQKHSGSFSNGSSFKKTADESDMESDRDFHLSQGQMPKIPQSQELTLKRGIFSQSETQNVNLQKQLHSNQVFLKGSALYNNMEQQAENGANFGLFRRDTESLMHYSVNLDFNLDQPAYFEDVEMRLFCTPRDNDFQNFFEKFMD